jgi:hypothetical protein
MTAEAARYRRIARRYAQKARATKNASDENMDWCLADGYLRLAKAYDAEAMGQSKSPQKYRADRLDGPSNQPVQPEKKCPLGWIVLAATV